VHYRDLVGRTLRDQASLLHHQHLVEAIQQAQPMDRGDERDIRESGEEIGVHPCFSRRIEARRRLVHENESATGRGENAACEGHAAALPP